MYQSLKSISDPVGIFGVVLILIAYYMVTSGKIKGSTLAYQILNLVGAVLMLFSLFFNWNLSSVVIQIAWIFVSFIGIKKLRKAKSASEKPVLCHERT